ncbi:hypothetical protein DRE_01147 [Drechslerella stenobrocha 248]|uniref:Uncharacterized protein n=1 Tax=Drechslerella stenobrocha 248 TaxID=1043628 RepID=W7HK03_9PEZI|nr:hypothetical protein DRE_01147 [Drechslerella stenobrocha 248]
MAPTDPVTLPVLPPLQSGRYLMKGVASRRLISRAAVEDRSLLPKAVVALRHERTIDAAEWDIKREDDGTYTLKNKNSIVVSIDGKLFGWLGGIPPPEYTSRWYLNPQLIATTDRAIAYTIVAAGKNASDRGRWVVGVVDSEDKEVDKQVSSRQVDDSAPVQRSEAFVFLRK